MRLSKEFYDSVRANRRCRLDIREAEGFAYI